MGIISGGGGGTTSAQVAASGKVLPVANAATVTVDSMTYSDTVAGGGAKLTTLIFPANQGALAIAIDGDTFPRWVLNANPRVGGFCFSGGNVDPTASGGAIYESGGAGGSSITVDGSGNSGGFVNLRCGSSGGVGLGGFASVTNDGVLTEAGIVTQAITSGALPTAAFVSGTARQLNTSRDVTCVIPFTGDATNNAATLLIQLSPDNSTFSTLDTLSIAAALNLTGAINVPVTIGVPAAWYVKLTASHGTIGTGTYY